MKVLSGRVRGGYGVAGHNLSHVVGLIEARTGVRPLVPGTLNLALSEPYVVHADATIERNEYKLNNEYIKLQRCRVGGVQALIMRPNTHEQGYAHGPAHLELLSTVVLRKHLTVEDGDVVPVEVEGDDDWWKGGE